MFLGGCGTDGSDPFTAGVGELVMLLWEALANLNQPSGTDPVDNSSTPVRVQRLPFDKRCSALTKAGVRCRGQIRGGGEFCMIHDPAIAAKRRAAQSDSRRKKHRRLSRLPDGYLRKLTNTAAVGQAMDRLYREVRLGIITTEMGTVMFNILTRLMDAELIPLGVRPDRTRAARIRPRLSEMLTRGERKTWKKAVKNAPQLTRGDAGESGSTSGADRTAGAPTRPQEAADRPAALVFQAAS